jgi:polyisoprenoid-binding protein YceI
MKIQSLLLLTFFASCLSFAMEVDLKGSQFNWTGTKLTGKHDGTISLKKASLVSDKEMIKGGEFVMDLTTITVGNIEDKEYQKKFLDHISSPDFFDVKKFPEAKLVIKEIKGNTAKGELTIKGKTNPINIDFKKVDKTYEGTMTFDRTKFDMIYHSGNFAKDLGDKLIHDKVTLGFKVVLK